MKWTDSKCIRDRPGRGLAGAKAAETLCRAEGFRRPGRAESGDEAERPYETTRPLVPRNYLARARPNATQILRPHRRSWYAEQRRRACGLGRPGDRASTAPRPARRWVTGPTAAGSALRPAAAGHRVLAAAASQCRAATPGGVLSPAGRGGRQRPESKANLPDRLPGSRINRRRLGSAPWNCADRGPRGRRRRSPVLEAAELPLLRGARPRGRPGSSPGLATAGERVGTCGAACR